MRALGKITEDMEKLITEMCDDHKLQWHEILGLVHSYLQTHRIDAQENYEDGTFPVYYYGHKEYLYENN